MKIQLVVQKFYEEDFMELDEYILHIAKNVNERSRLTSAHSIADFPPLVLSSISAPRCTNCSIICKWRVQKCQGWGGDEMA